VPVGVHSAISDMDDDHCAVLLARLGLGQAAGSGPAPGHNTQIQKKIQEKKTASFLETSVLFFLRPWVPQQAIACIYHATRN
jgi:hypothetical protein